MRRIIEIRTDKKKPKLKDLLKMFEGKDLSNPKEKEALRRKILSLYSENKNEEEDIKYNKVHKPRVLSELAHGEFRSHPEDNVDAAGGARAT